MASKEVKGRQTVPLTTGQLITATAMGAVFGFALEKGRVFEPLVIRDQMLMQRFVMMKMFLSAVAAGQVALILTSIVSPATFRKSRQAFCGASIPTVGGVAIGAGLLGVGMTLSGACPGMVLVQVGSGVPNSLITLAGCFAGAILYGIMEPSIKNMVRQKAGPVTSLDAYLEKSYIPVALGLNAALLIMILGFETFFPWKTELSFPNSGTTILSQAAWPPIATGILVGALQIPAAYLLSDTLGSATSYCVLASQALSESIDYFRPYKTSTYWWQVVYVAGAILGAKVSSSLAATGGAVPGVDAGFAFLGGVCLLFGSRMGGGCTSGHGLSGMSLLNLGSFVAIPAMFGGGIASAFALSAAGLF